MTMDSALHAPHYSPRSGQKPRQIVVLLHGVGDNGDGLISLAEDWAELLPDALFVSPDAPEPFDMAPFGHQWFSLKDWSPISIAAGARAAGEHLNAWLDSLLAETGLTESALALVGFSQGGMMALHIAPRRAQQLAGVISYSGALVTGDQLVEECRAKPPMLLIHGAEDEVVPSGMLETTQNGLESVGIRVETHLRPGLGHGIDSFGVDRGGTFLAECFKTRSRMA